MSDTKERFSSLDTSGTDSLSRAIGGNAGSAAGSAASSDESAQRLPRWSTRQLATMAIMLAVGIVLSFIEFPLLPGTDFLKFDASFVPIALIGFIFGPAAGCTVGVLVAIVHALFSGNIWGAVMNSFIVVAFVLPPALICRRNKSIQRAALGLVVGGVLAIGVALLMNLLITPLYMVPDITDLQKVAEQREKVVIPMIMFPILPFNILKETINVVLTLAIFSALRPILRPILSSGSNREVS